MTDDAAELAEPGGSFEEQVAGVAALNDPVRRGLYLFVVDSGEPVSRDQAAEAVGVQRSLAAFHLDKLAEEGLLDVEFRRLTGRTGPGAGRPAKLYRRSQRQIDITLPHREYDLAGQLMAQAIDDAERTHIDVRTALENAAFEFGRGLGALADARAGRKASDRARRDALVEVLRLHGFEPHVAGDDVVLRNCPFHTLAQQFTHLVCGMNLHLMQGARGALRLRGDGLRPRLEPEPGQCCVKFGNAA